MTDSTLPASVPETADELTATPPGPDAGPAEFHALAAQFAAQAAAVRDQAAADQEQARAILAEAEAEAARLVADARRRSQALANGTLSADRRAAEIGSRAGGCRNAARLLADDIPDADQRAADLAGERELLTGQAAELEVRIAAVRADRDTAAAGLDAAREAADLDAVTGLRARLAAGDDLLTALAARSGTIRDRLAAIGDDQGTGELKAALTAASGHRAALRRVIGQTWPDSPEAVADRERAEALATIAAWRQPPAGEAAARKSTAQQIVML